MVIEILHFPWQGVTEAEKKHGDKSSGCSGEWKHEEEDIEKFSSIIFTTFQVGATQDVEQVISLIQPRVTAEMNE